jgi:alpha/beta hydrolase family protein
MAVLVCAEFGRSRNMADIKPVLEQAAQEFADATANPPFLFDLSIEEGRKTVDSVQDGDVPAPAADVTDHVIPGGPWDEVNVKVYPPQGSSGTLPVVLYIHGAGWVFGDAHTHDRLVRELTTRAQAATVFVCYRRLPESRYPKALEEIYVALQWIAQHGADNDLDPARIAVAGDSVSPTRSEAERRPDRRRPQHLGPPAVQRLEPVWPRRHSLAMDHPAAPGTRPQPAHRPRPPAGHHHRHRAQLRLRQREPLQPTIPRGVSHIAPRLAPGEPKP